jgi:hypothetical protein
VWYGFGKTKAKRFGGKSGSDGRDIAVDPNGNIYLIGSFYSDIDLGGGTLVTKGGFDTFIASFTASGTHRWSKNLNCQGDDHGLGVAADASGNVYVTGDFGSSIDLGSGPLTSNGSYDRYIASFSPSGRGATEARAATTAIESPSRAAEEAR